MLRKKEEEGEGGEGGTLRKKYLKLQPYLDFWASELGRDFSCPAYVLFGVSLSPCLSSCLPLSLFSSAPICLYFPDSPFEPATFSMFWNVDVLLVDTVHEC